MNCREFQEHLEQAFETAHPPAPEAITHAVLCAPCNAVMERERQLVDALGSGPSVPEGLVDSVRARLAGEPTPQAPAQPPRAAAAVMLCAGLTLAWWAFGGLDGAAARGPWTSLASLTWYGNVFATATDLELWRQTGLNLLAALAHLVTPAPRESLPAVPADLLYAGAALAGLLWVILGAVERRGWR